MDSSGIESISCKFCGEQVIPKQRPVKKPTEFCNSLCYNRYKRKQDERQ